MDEGVVSNSDINRIADPVLLATLVRVFPIIYENLNRIQTQPQTHSLHNNSNNNNMKMTGFTTVQLIQFLNACKRMVSFLLGESDWEKVIWKINWFFLLIFNYYFF